VTRLQNDNRGCRRLCPHPLLFFLCGLLTASSSALAEDIHNLIDGAPRSWISIGVGSMPSRAFQNYAGSFTKQMTSLSAEIPFAGDSLSEWSMRTSLHTTAAEVSLLPKRVSLFSGVVAVSKRIYDDVQNQYIISCGVGFAFDDQLLDAVRFRFSGIGVGTHSWNQDFALLYGLSYSYVLGRGLILPVAGFHWEASDGVSLRAMLPFSVRLHYRVSERWLFGLKAMLDGDRFQYFNDVNTFSAPQHAYLRLTQLECGPDFVLTVSPLLSLSGEVGVAVARRLWISSDSGDFLSAKINPGGYARATARFSL
jgi:hypothetical protein